MPIRNKPRKLTWHLRVIITGINLKIKVERGRQSCYIIKIDEAGAYCRRLRFCIVSNPRLINMDDVVLFSREKEGITVVIKKDLADSLRLSYSFVASWITLTFHSWLGAIGFTAAFTAAPAKEEISCNVVAAFYHDYIFVTKKDTGKALVILKNFGKKG